MSDDGPWLNVPQAVVLEATRDIELVLGLTETNPALLVIRANQLIALRTEIPLEPDADNEQRGGLDCDAPLSEGCDWSQKSYAALKSVIEDWVPAGGFWRAQTLKQIATLENPPYVRDEASARAWADIAEASSRSPKPYPEVLAETLEDVGCAADGAPYVMSGLIRELDYRFEKGSSQEAAVAAAFLNEANCPGARGLSEENKAKLQEIRDRGLPAAPGPGPAAR